MVWIFVVLRLSLLSGCRWCWRLRSLMMSGSLRLMMNWGDLGIIMRRLRLRGVLSWRGLCSYCCLGCSCIWSLVVIWGWMDIVRVCGVGVGEFRVWVEEGLWDVGVWCFRLGRWFEDWGILLFVVEKDLGIRVLG